MWGDTSMLHFIIFCTVTDYRLIYILLNAWQQSKGRTVQCLTVLQLDNSRSELLSRTHRDRHSPQKTHMHSVWGNISQRSIDLQSTWFVWRLTRWTICTHIWTLKTGQNVLTIPKYPHNVWKRKTTIERHGYAHKDRLGWGQGDCWL